MIAMGLVQSIDGLTGLMDAYLFYRFTADKVSMLMNDSEMAW